MTAPVDAREAIALVLLNSDRSMAGFPPVESRTSIPDSDGYVVNADAILASPACRAVASERIAGLEGEVIKRCADHLRERAKGFRKAAFDQSKRAGPLALGFETAADEIAALVASDREGGE